MLDRSITFTLLRDALAADHPGVVRTVLMGMYQTGCEVDPFTSTDPLIFQLRCDENGLRFGFDLPIEEEAANAVAQRLIALRPIFLAARGQRWTRLVNLGDGCSAGDVSFCSNHSQALLIPDPHFLDSNGYRDARKQFVQMPSWAERIPQALWRGSTTGTRRSLDEVFSLPRLILCGLAREKPEFDCAIAGESYLSQMNDEEKLRVMNSGLVKNEVPSYHFCTYQVNIDIDGNTNSWPGLFCKLLAGSPVVKVDSDYRQWYYDRLVPYENYIPAAADLSDIEEKVHWCLDHGAEAAAVGQRGRDLALSLIAPTEVAQARMRLFDTPTD